MRGLMKWLRHSIMWLQRRYPAKFDLVFLLLARPCARMLLAYRTIGTSKLPRTTGMLRDVGVFPITHGYYEPFFLPGALRRPLEEDRFLPGLDLNEAGQLSLLERMTFAGELVDLAWDETPGERERFHLRNMFYGWGDAEFLYQFLRVTKPGRVLEIGSGHSTKVARLALGKNRAETGIVAIHRCVEPFENEWLEGMEDIELIRTAAENLELDWPTALAAGDLLFIDSSHMIRPQGDVLKEYLEILPQLASGVYVHVHDVFTPKDYLRRWLEQDVVFWNEQYLLEALLSNTDRYEVVAALNYLQHHHYDALSRVCPYLDATKEPTSFYLRVR